MQQFVAQTAADRDTEARRRLDQLTLEIDADFDRYPSVRDSEEDALLNGMRGVFSQQRTFYITILAARPAERRHQAESLLADHLVPVQKQILDWSGKLQVWNSERLQHADRGARDPVCESAGKPVPGARHRIRKRSAARAG